MKHTTPCCGVNGSESDVTILPQKTFQVAQRQK
jgi:hypothetical protein